MRQFLAVVFIGSVLLLSSGRTASAANLAGYDCSQLGKTTMDDNQQNIVACVYNASHQLKWKNMTSSSDSACASGQALVSIVNGVPACGTVAAAASTTSTTDTSSTPASGTQCGYASWTMSWVRDCTNQTSNTCKVNQNVKCNGVAVLATCPYTYCAASDCVFSCPPGYTRANYASSSSNSDSGCRVSNSTTYSATCVAK